MTSNKAMFFGSGPVAARSLEKLLDYTEVEAVITKPRPAHHHGDVPVIDVARRHSLPILTASNRRELDSLIGEQDFTSDHAILIDFGIIVSEKVINAFPLGIINSHFSLLPKLRGADPITWAIANGDTKTGVSLMLIDTGMDTGKLITQKSLTLDGSESSEILTTKLIDLSDQLIKDYLPRYLSGDIVPRNQPHPDRATYSRKLTKDDGIIDWQQPAAQIERQIRAFSEWPKSHTKLGVSEVIITSAKLSDRKALTPGKILVEKNCLFISASDFYLEILTLKPSGKKNMPANAFLAGYRDQI